MAEKAGTGLESTGEDWQKWLGLTCRGDGVMARGKADMAWRGSERIGRDGQKWCAQERIGQARYGEAEMEQQMTWVKPESQPLVAFGQKFNRLTVCGEIDRSEKAPRVLVKCDCGVKKLVLITNLKNGKTKSCGCYARDQRRAATALNIQRIKTKKHG